MRIHEIQTLLEPVVSGLGYILWGLEWATEGRGVLRLYIDHADGIKIEDCEKVSKQVSALLDVQNLIENAYRLEVSSPGFDRPFFKPEQFTPFIGSVIRIKLGIPLNGRGKLKGLLKASTSESICLQLSPEEEVSIPHVNIRGARLVPIFDQGGLK